MRHSEKNIIKGGTINPERGVRGQDRQNTYKIIIVVERS